MHRYFVMNAFDGAIIIFGVLFGSYIVGVTDSSVIVSLCVSTLIAASVSGLSGAYLTESAERQKEMDDLEKKMLVSLEKSEIATAFNRATFFASIVNSLAQLFSGIFIILPFIFIDSLNFSISIAYHASFVLSFIFFFLLGAYLGKVTHQKMLISGIKMLTVGTICAILSWIILSA